MPMTTLAFKVRPEVADAVRATADLFGETVSDMLREYCEAIAAGRRYMIADDDDEMPGRAPVPDTLEGLDG